jgi:hypothetical protein
MTTETDRLEAVRSALAGGCTVFILALAEALLSLREARAQVG